MRYCSLVRHALAVLACCLAFAAVPRLAAAQTGALEPPENPTPAEMAQARVHMGAGVAFIQDPDGAKYEDAYPEFKKAYLLSGSLNALLNLAICAQKLERDGEAITLYRKYVAGKGDSIDAATKEQIQRDMPALEAVVAWVTLSTDLADVTVTDVRTPARGFPITNVYQLPAKQPVQLGIHPGRHALTASVAGKSDKVWNIELANGSAHKYDFLFEAPKPPEPKPKPEAKPAPKPETKPEAKPEAEPEVKPEPEPEPGPEPQGGPIGLPPWHVWAAAGGTVAAGAVWAALGVVALQKNKQLKDSQGKEDEATLRGLYDDTRNFNMAADICMGVTIAGAAATGVLGFLAWPWGGEGQAASAPGEQSQPPAAEEQDKEPEEVRRRPSRRGYSLSVAPAPERGGAGAVLMGRF
ncbi:MAG: hypothetical protein HY744_06895 [Deltaproteobacteria bacterium]|nr:hypothetical protein [Deltaproteobacteria bacterium]